MIKLNTEEGIIEFPGVDMGEFFNLENARRKIIPAQFEFIENLSKKLGIKKESQIKLF